jgi:hypothetical protein
MNKYYIYIFLFAIIFSGCASRSDFTAISSKNVNVSNIQIDRAKSKGKATGEDCTVYLFLWPVGGRPTLDEALDNALEPKQANILFDAVANWNIFHLLIAGQECWKVEGEAYDSYQ